MNKTAFALAAAIAASGSTAIAQPVEQAPSIVVSFADLDLAHPAGRATLERRVSHAVTRLCGTPFVLDTRAMASHRACRTSAWTGAARQLTALYGRSLYAGPAPLEVAVN